jgi:DNA-binding CsgD family transcriptional regulator
MNEMISDAVYRELLSFTNELAYKSMTSRKNMDYRSNCLKLIKKYFGYDRASFNYFDNPSTSVTNLKVPNFDNVTLGLPNELMREYYGGYCEEDPLRESAEDVTVMRLSDIVSQKEFEKTGYFKNFYRKHDIYYQIGAAIKTDKKVIGTLSFFRSKAQGDFTQDDVDFVSLLRDSVASGLYRSLENEAIRLENYALKHYQRLFPVAQIMLGHDYNVVYHNDWAEPFCRELTGTDVRHFKTWFVNRIRPRLDLGGEETTFDIADFRVKVVQKVQDKESVPFRQRYYVMVYIAKTGMVVDENIPASDAYDSLSAREKEIVTLLRRGLTHTVIAEKLSISTYTVKTHLQHIYRKFDVNNRTALIFHLTNSEQ